jgi:probable DNA metabolism protein
MAAIISEPFSFDSWRDIVRPWLAAGHKADDIVWRGTASDIADRAFALTSGATSGRASADLRLPRALMSLLRRVACFRHDSRWELMYRLAWRMLYENPHLLADPADPDVAHATRMERAVGRDIHKMHAFVRFREIADGEAPTYFAWFEPQHEILEAGSRFFVKRFPNMHWTIATPDGAAVWNGELLQFVASAQVGERPTADEQEDLWRTYYRSICNVARINPIAMQREMPKHYWHNLPEAAEISPLMREGMSQFAARHSQSDHATFTEAKSVQRSLAQLHTPANGPQTCRLCDLWKNATQAVEGEGAPSARLMLVGEQPGDEEDLKGKPFVGPAGKVLDDLLSLAGLDRSQLYVTNAVKHFKWEPRGKRRLHKRPNAGEIRICNVWLVNEIAVIKPAVIVALGASALTALHPGSLSIDAARKQELVHPSGSKLIATYHPSAILRADADRADTLRDALIADLKRAKSELR